MKFSIIIPAYNAEKNITETIEKIEKIRFPKSEYEVIVVNDGSVDNTLSVLHSLKKNISNLLILDKKNGGVSSARNEGIRAAKGEYMLFVDADDSVSPNILEAISNFIEKYGKINIITYNLEYSNGTHHWRKDYLQKTGVYNASEYCFANLTTINICVKNRNAQNILFNEGTYIHEDEEYSAKIVSLSNEFGFIAEATYFYNNANADSVMNTKLNPYYSFDPSLQIYKSLIENSIKDTGKVSRYVQSLIINDLSWKLRSNCLFSLNEGIRQKQTDAVSALLTKVSDKVILQHPNIDTFHKQYFLKLKRSEIKIKIDGIKIIEEVDNQRIHVKENHIYITKIARDKDQNKIRISGFLKNYISDFLDWSSIEIFAILNNRETIRCLKRETYYSYHRSNTKTNNFIGFDVSIPVSFDQIYFIISVLGCCYKINTISFKEYNLRDKLPITVGTSTEKLHLVYDKKEAVFFNIKNAFEKKKLYINELKYFLVNSKGRLLFKLLTDLYPKGYQLYIDREGVLDNAFQKFLKDKEKIKKGKIYYIYHNNEDKKRIIDEFKVEEGYLIKFHSLKHQLAYLNSERIYTSFVDSNFYLPFGSLNYRKFYSNLSKPEIVYLQHGVLHAVGLHYAAEFLGIDKITIATYQELEYFQKLGFRENQLIKTGLERFKNKKRKDLNVNNQIKKLLYIPSWRSYLATKDSNNQWSVNYKKFQKSSYWMDMKKWNQSNFIEFLKKNNLIIDIQLHPIFSKLDIALNGENINFINNADISNYDLIITDYSSIVYDAVYLGKPIVYYCPDIIEFHSGLNLYCDTLVKMEDGFGPFTSTTEELINVLGLILDKKINFDKYAKRYQSTFLEF